MNKVILVGNLTKDPELVTTNNGISLCRFTLAVQRRFTSGDGEREADFINIVVWRKQAENVKNYLTQGSQVAIDGRLQTRTYDGEDGKKRYITEVVADNVQFLDSKSSRESSFDSTSSSSGVTPSSFSQEITQTTDVKNDPFADFGASIEINDDELPF